MAGFSFLYLKPLKWSQSIELHPGLKGTPSEGWTKIDVTCTPTANCDVLLSNGAKLQDFQIPISILEGQLPDDQRSKFESDAIGGLAFVEEQYFVHGYFYLPETIYRTLWDQVRDGQADCHIMLTVSPVGYDNIWKDGPLSIVSASLTFGRKPPPDEKAQKKTGLSRLFSAKESRHSGD